MPMYIFHVRLKYPYFLCRIFDIYCLCSFVSPYFWPKFHWLIYKTSKIWVLKWVEISEKRLNESRWVELSWCFQRKRVENESRFLKLSWVPGLLGTRKISVLCFWDQILKISWNCMFLTRHTENSSFVFLKMNFEIFTKLRVFD